MAYLSFPFAGLPLYLLAALYNVRLRLVTKQLASPGAISFALVSYTSGSYTCSFCSKSTNGTHTKCVICGKTICALPTQTVETACAAKRGCKVNHQTKVV